MIGALDWDSTADVSDPDKQPLGITIMFDTAAFYSILKSVMVDKAKEQHKPSIDNKASMAAYAKATGNTGKAKFMSEQSEVIEYV